MFLYGGSILPGSHNGKAHDIMTVFEAVGAHAAGTMSLEELDDIERGACPSEGSCAGMFTANTMASVAEAIGMSLPGSSSRPGARQPPRRLRLRVAVRPWSASSSSASGPRHIMTKEAFENAIAVTMALGGSTNAVLVLGPRVVTFAELDERSSRVAQGLRALASGASDRIAFLAKNCLEYFEVAVRRGQAQRRRRGRQLALTPAEIAYTINDAGANVLIVGADFFGTLDGVRGGPDGTERIVAIGEHPEWPSYESWLGAPDATDPGRAAPRRGLAALHQRHHRTAQGRTHQRDLFALLGKVQRPWRFDDTSVNLVCMPLFHIAGCEWALAGMDFGAPHGARARLRSGASSS